MIPRAKSYGGNHQIVQRRNASFPSEGKLLEDRGSEEGSDPLNIYLLPGKARKKNHPARRFGGLLEGEAEATREVGDSCQKGWAKDREPRTGISGLTSALTD